MAAGRYRVTINGFEVNSQTWDDALQLDGKGDEVFLSASVKEADASGNITQIGTFLSSTIGDSNGQPGRIQGGSLSSKGGFQTNDKFPTDTPWKRLEEPRSDRHYPPYAIWEGDLVQGEKVLFIAPTIWEWDPGSNLWEGWLQWHQQTDEKFGAKAKDIFGGRWPLVKWIFDAVSLGIQTAATLTNVGGPIGTSGSRPIGFQLTPGDATGKSFTFNPQVLILDYNRAEELVRDEPAGSGKGVIAFNYSEHKYFRGNYTIWLQVERIGVSTEDAKAGPNEAWTGEAYFGSRGTFFADVTGDGKADAIVVNEDGVTVRRSTGNGFGPNEAWTGEAYFGSRGTFFADVTGDGKADAIVVNEDGVTVRRSK